MKRLFTLLFLIISTYSYAYQANLSINPNISQFTNDSGYTTVSSTINYSTKSGTAVTVSAAEQPAITSVGTLKKLDIAVNDSNALTSGLYLSNIANSGTGTNFYALDASAGLSLVYNGAASSYTGARIGKISLGSTGRVSWYDTHYNANTSANSYWSVGSTDTGAGSITANEVLKLTGNGNLYLYGLGSAGAGTALVIDSNKQIIPLTSSRRFKKDIKTLNVDSSLLYKLRPVEFNYKGSGSHDLGFIAEEVNLIIPEVVNYDKENNPYSLKNEAIITLLVKEIQQLNKRIKKLEKRSK